MYYCNSPPWEVFANKPNGFSTWKSYIWNRNSLFDRPTISPAGFHERWKVDCTFGTLEEMWNFFHKLNNLFIIAFLCLSIDVVFTVCIVVLRCQSWPIDVCATFLWHHRSDCEKSESLLSYWNCCADVKVINLCLYRWNDC